MTNLFSPPTQISWGLLLLEALCSGGSLDVEPTWQSFRVTWGLNILSSRTFSKLPQTEGRARSEGFARLAGECSGGKFVGHRFMKGLDTAAVIIYDDNGYVAGLQHG
ncbi:hypothetical protein AVEN_118056-2, partial [Araneus ventricosus]